MLVGVATALVIVTVALVPLLTPQWMAFEQGRTNVTGWTGYSEAEVAAATNAILGDLVIGPPDFDVEIAGEPVLNERERGHMRDVRSVFVGLWILTIAAAVLLVVASRADRAWFWRSVSRGASMLAIAVLVVGAVALVAFDALFEAFHRVFFAGGNYTFDPAQERLVQLFPFAFWQETAIVAGLLIVALSAVVAWFAVGRGRPAHASGSATSPVRPEPVA